MLIKDKELKMEMLIRDARDEEQDFINELKLNAYEEHAHKIQEGHWTVLRNSVLSNAELQADVIRLVAEMDGKIVGSVALFPAKMDAYKGLTDEKQDYPEIRMLAVSREARGKGVARALVNECIQRAKGKGYRSIGLHTADFMEDAIDLYSRLGFERLTQYDFEPSDDGVVVKAFRLKI